MSDLAERRRFFADEIEAVGSLQTRALVDALAAVPREDYLPPGPWTILSIADYMPVTPAAPRVTPDADPKRVYHNVGIAIDPSRQLFNGQPGTLAVWVDALGLTPGARVLHVGCGLGYYTAVMAHAAGPAGRVVAYEIDEALAADARRRLRSFGWVDVRHGDASAVLDEAFDAILVNAGVTHPLDAWLDALAPGGRMVLPLTTAMPAMGPTLGKGLMWTLTRAGTGDNPDLTARMTGVVAIYSAVGLRDDEMNARIGKAMMSGPASWSMVKRLRRDQHEPVPSCWLHRHTCCFSA
jgi:protein-L-isoaspartate(D-aspartate) O-methyltransferase